MDKYFNIFLENISLTALQNADAMKKYTGVCEKLHSCYYNGKYDDSKKFLFGSYKTKTNIRPLTEMQDVDVLFKIPREEFEKYYGYETNGQSALLQDVRKFLQEKYSTTDSIKAWGKVILIEFSDNHHNVELLPALEQENGTFIIPNSKNGGSWDVFDPRVRLKKIEKSCNSTKDLTRDLIKMLKSWAHNHPSLDYKSYKREDDIIAFLDSNYDSGANNSGYDKIIFDFFDYMKLRCESSISSFITTAHSQAQKALEYSDKGMQKEASEEWRKIFGSSFPLANKNVNKQSSKEIINPARPWSN